MSLGQVIRNRREMLGLTQDQVAGRADISKPYLSNIETNRAKNPPTDGVLTRLEAALQMEEGDLLRLAQLERTPPAVRQEHELLEAELQKYRSVLKQLMDAREEQNVETIDELMAQIEAADNITPLGDNTVVPVINKVTAGYPHHFTDLDYPPSVAQEYIRCPDLNDPQAFGARVVGDSMAPEFTEGDIVIFSPASAPTNGADCFVGFDDGETTFKRMYQDEPESIRLQPLNPSYPAQTVESRRVTGLWPAVARFQKLR